LSATKFHIWDGTNVYPSLNIIFNTFPASVTSFSNLTIGTADTTANALAYNGSNTAVTFSMDYYVAGGLVTRNIGVKLGTCGQPTALACDGEDYQRRKDLETLLNHLAVAGKLASGSATNLSNDPFFTIPLSSVLGPTSYHYLNSVSGDSLIAPIVNDTTLDTACTVYLHFNTTPGGGNDWTDVNKITNLVANIDEMQNGVAYDFTATAWFSDNSSAAITGYSCWGIRNCSECVANSANTYQTYDNFNSGSPGFTTTLTYTASCPATGYYTVTKNADTLCTPATLSGLDHTIPGAGKYLYTAFSSNGAQTLWSTTTTVAAFTSYNFSAWYMNLNVDTGLAQNNVTLELWANSTLVASTLVSDTSGGIWQKLSGVWNGTSTAGSITIEVKTSGGGAVNTKLGLDDIGFNTQGCGLKPVLFPGDTTPSYPYCDSCGQNMVNISIANGNAMYLQYIDSVKADFRAKYIKHCMDSVVEIFTRTDTLREYHYTLYYYDQGGNLVRTIPPAGVTPINLATYGQAIKHERAYRTQNPTASKTFYTSHTLATTYTYNTLNQLVQQVTPDGDTSRFYYDKLGRIVASQNAKQKAYSTPRYSYTKYDAQGRISEVGELATSNNLRTASFATQQTWLNDYNYPDLLDGAAVSSGNLRYQVTKTFYDEIKFSSAAARFSNSTQENLRKRVASAAIYEVYDGTDADYDNATHYSYDLHGNVQELVQENPELNDLNDISNSIYQTYKNMQYSYDLVSGKVNELDYNKGNSDQYFYKYEYDADNRVTAAYTSTDGRQWDRDAKYFYYLHGPLARTEIGQDKVQGEDYAYTLHGWIKGVNAAKMDSSYEMGKDADATFTVNLNRYIASDQFGYILTYYDTTGHTDYTAIGGGGWNPSQTGSSLQSTSPNLWNGNIKNMITSIRTFMPTGRPQARAFKYDQLNRIIGAQVDTNFVTGTNSWGTNGNKTSWQERFTIDENGNITKLVRRGKTPVGMDSLDYHYNSGTNQLNYVDDGISSVNYGDDIDDEAANNYTYDKIGNLVGDVSEEIDTIRWNVYGKIEKVIRSSTSSKSDLEFHYDAMGNRICKIVKPRAGSGILTQENWTYTYYLRDAQGNVLATYDRTFRTRTGGFTEAYNLKENDLYGSSRTGIRNTTFEVATVNLTTSGYNSDQTIHVTATAAGSGTALSTTIFNHKLGEKSYELVNHLGNVLVTVSDMRTVYHSGSNITSFKAVVNSATDYYAFGSAQEGRSYTSTAYRYGMNGQEHEEEIVSGIYTAQFWEYDSRLGRRWNTDPVVKRWESPYATFNNNPISIIDINGNDGEETNDCGQGQPEITSAMPDQGTSIDLNPATPTAEETCLEICTSETPMKIWYVYEAATPIIYANVKAGLNAHPEWSVLTYIGPQSDPQYADQIDANRHAACPPGSCGYMSISCDEFPMASTKEGGKNSFTACVPAYENSIQGGQLGGFGGIYRTMQPGEQFKVELVPNPNPIKVPVSVPVEQPAPLIPAPPPIFFMPPSWDTPEYQPPSVPPIFVPNLQVPFLLGIPFLLEQMIEPSRQSYGQSNSC
jgi:YD repeat-containing protein